MAGQRRAEMAEEKPAAVHLLVFPYPAQGHMRPLLHLAHLLALRRGITLTVITTPKNLPSLSPLLAAHPSTVRSLVLPFPPHPELPPGVENVRDIGNRGNFPIMSALRSLRGPIAEWFRSHPDPPIAVISDFFLGWTTHLATELGVPRIAFFSSGAFLVSVSDHCWRNVAAVQRLEVVPFPGLPNSPAFREEHLPSVFRYYRESDPDSEQIKDGMIANTSSWGCIFNSFEALEGPYLDHLRTKMGHGRVYGVGPLSLVGLTNNSSGRASLDEHTLLWLDGCPDGSVLYICFGSQKVLKTDQMDALARALEMSGARFLWVVNTGSARGANDGPWPFLDEFEARSGDRGKIIRGWAPQVAILDHKAVGGFLSHCGWNSVLEAVVAAGVVLVAWPMEADQYVDARLLVEDMGVATRVCEGADTVPDPGVLSRAIAGSMREDSKERAKAKELRDGAWAAVKRGGSSSRDLDVLVEELFLLGRAA